MRTAEDTYPYEPMIVNMARQATMSYRTEVEKDRRFQERCWIFQAVTDTPAPAGSKYTHNEHVVQAKWFDNESFESFLDKWRAAVIELGNKVQAADAQDTFI